MKHKNSSHKEYTCYTFDMVGVPPELRSIAGFLRAYFSDFFCKYGASIAGGFVRSCLEKNVDNYSDIDIFFQHRTGFFAAKRSLRRRVRVCMRGEARPYGGVSAEDVVLRPATQAMAVGSNASSFSSLHYGYFASLPQCWSLRSEKWHLHVSSDRLGDRLGFPLGTYTINIICRDRLAEPSTKTPPENILDNFDINACRAAIRFSPDTRDSLIVLHPYTIWDVSTRTISFNEQAKPGFRDRPFSKARYWLPVRLGNRIAYYMNKYDYALDAESLGQYVDELKRQVERGELIARKSTRKHMLEVLDGVKLSAQEDGFSLF